MARWIKYIGPAHQRIITAANWRSVGVNGETVVWSAYNGFTVPADSLTEDQISKAIDGDSQFVIVGEEDDFRPQMFSHDMTPALAAQTAENPVDMFALLDGSDNASTADSGVVPGAGGAAPTTTGTTGGAGSDTAGSTAH
jgi:hypothetical protein